MIKHDNEKKCGLNNEADDKNFIKGDPGPIKDMTHEQVRAMLRKRVSSSLREMSPDHPVARTIAELSEVKDK